jgi:predicted Zn-dependent protease
MAAYRLPDEDDAITQALLRFPDAPALRMSAARLWDAQGEPARADQVLLEGLSRSPDQAELRNAALLRGLELPPLPAEEPDEEPKAP